MKARILSFVLTVALLLTSVFFVFPVTATEADVEIPALPGAVDAKGKWSDYAAESFANGVTYPTAGYGTAANPYLISSAEELAYLAKLSNEFDPTDVKTIDINGTATDVVYNTNKMNGVHFKLIADIDLSAHNWDPIAKTRSGNYAWPDLVTETPSPEGEAAPAGEGEGEESFVPTQRRVFSFEGIFDGDNHKVTGLTFTSELLDENGEVPAEYAGFGLFGIIANPAVIKNVYIESYVSFEAWKEEETDSGIKKTATFKFVSSYLHSFYEVDKEADAAANINCTVGSVSAAVAASYGATMENVQVNTRSAVYGSMSNELLVTGLCGFTTYHKTATMIKNCTVYGSLLTQNAIPNEADTDAEFSSGTQPMTTGFVGWAAGATVFEDSVNYANIEQNTKNTNCIASCFLGKTSTNTISTGDESGNRHKGDVDLIWFENCINYGDLYVMNYKGSSSNTRAGAFVGNAGRGGKFYGDVVIYDCINYGDVGASFMGGSSGVAAIIGYQEATNIYMYYCFSTTMPHLDDASKALELKYEGALIDVARSSSRHLNGKPSNTGWSQNWINPPTCAIIDTPAIEVVPGARLLINPEDTTTASIRFDFDINDGLYEGLVGVSADFEIMTVLATAAVMDEAAAEAGSTSAQAIYNTLVNNSKYEGQYKAMPFATKEGEESLAYAANRFLESDLFDTEYTAIAFVTFTNNYTGVEYLFDTEYVAGDEDRSASIRGVANAYYNDLRYNEQNADMTYKPIDEKHLIEGKGTYSVFTTEQLDLVKGYLDA